MKSYSRSERDRAERDRDTKDSYSGGGSRHYRNNDSSHEHRSRGEEGGREYRRSKEEGPRRRSRSRHSRGDYYSGSRENRDSQHYSSSNKHQESSRSETQSGRDHYHSADYYSGSARYEQPREKSRGDYYSEKDRYYKPTGSYSSRRAEEQKEPLRTATDSYRTDRDERLSKTRDYDRDYDRDHERRYRDDYHSLSREHRSEKSTRRQESRHRHTEQEKDSEQERASSRSTTPEEDDEETSDQKPSKSARRSAKQKQRTLKHLRARKAASEFLRQLSVSPSHEDSQDSSEESSRPKHNDQSSREPSPKRRRISNASSIHEAERSNMNSSSHPPRHGAGYAHPSQYNTPHGSPHSAGSYGRGGYQGGYHNQQQYNANAYSPHGQNNYPSGQQNDPSYYQNTQYQQQNYYNNNNYNSHGNGHYAADKRHPPNQSSSTSHQNQEGHAPMSKVHKAGTADDDNNPFRPPKNLRVEDEGPTMSTTKNSGQDANNTPSTASASKVSFAFKAKPTPVAKPADLASKMKEPKKENVMEFAKRKTTTPSPALLAATPAKPSAPVDSSRSGTKDYHDREYEDSSYNNSSHKNSSYKDREYKDSSYKDSLYKEKSRESHREHRNSRRESYSKGKDDKYSRNKDDKYSKSKDDTYYESYEKERHGHDKSSYDERHRDERYHERDYKKEHKREPLGDQREYYEKDRRQSKEYFNKRSSKYEERSEDRRYNDYDRRRDYEKDARHRHEPKPKPEPPKPQIMIVKKKMTRVVPRPVLSEEHANSMSVYFRKPGNESVIGAGTYGKVFKAVQVYTKEEVALKKIRMEGERDGFPVTAIREVKLLQSLHHPNIVKLLEVMVEFNDCYMVFEYASHDLTGLLNHPNFMLSAAHKKHLIKQLFEALDYLHRRGVLHRDIKAANILVTNRGELKLADFGLARFYKKQKAQDYTNRVITIWYRPPELLLGETQYGAAVDIWSAACVMIEVFTKHAIFPGNGHEIDQLEKIYNMLGTPTLEEWPGMKELAWFDFLRPIVKKPNLLADRYQQRLTPEAFDLMTKLFVYDPKNRPTAEMVLKHKYFTEEEPEAAQAVELEDLVGDWHEFESKALRRKKEQRDKEARRQAEEERNKRKAAVLEGSEPGPDQKKSKSISRGAAVPGLPSE